MTSGDNGNNNTLSLDNNDDNDDDDNDYDDDDCMSRSSSERVEISEENELRECTRSFIDSIRSFITTI